MTNGNSTPVGAGAEENPIVLFGTGAYARRLRYYLHHDSTHRVAAFTVHREFLTVPEVDGVKVIPFEEIEAFFPPERYPMFVAVGYSRMNRVRAEIFEQARRKGYGFVTYVDSGVRLWDTVTTGRNCCVMVGSVLAPDVHVGDDVMIGGANAIGHNVAIHEHAFVTSGTVIGGFVQVGAYSVIGLGAVIRDGVHVAPRTMVGMGAVITHDTREGEVYKAPAAELSRVPSSRLRDL
ncbi:MAG: acetyltransferase [Lentisphaeria bacterium]|nr:acetyltransferase [Lentisphaeria bacterium]